MFWRERICWCWLPAPLAMTFWRRRCRATACRGLPAATGALLQEGTRAQPANRPCGLPSGPRLSPPGHSVAATRRSQRTSADARPALGARRHDQHREDQDYSATVVKRERIGNKLGDYQYMFVKVRHKPFSVYMYFLAPAASKGQEVIYVPGANNNKMWAHAVGIRDTMFGTVSLEPDGLMAMRASVPADRDGHPQPHAAADRGRRAGHQVRRVRSEVLQGGEDQQSRLHLRPGHASRCRGAISFSTCARIFVDDELNVPVRYEAYEWPKTAAARRS